MTNYQDNLSDKWEFGWLIFFKKILIYRYLTYVYLVLYFFDIFILIGCAIFKIKNAVLDKILNT